MRFSRTISLCLIVIAIYWSYRVLTPQYSAGETKSETEFSVDRALTHVENLAQQPHAVGFAGHAKTLAQVIASLKELGLQTEVQKGYTGGDWGNLSQAQNVLARIKGREEGKALLLLSHYDSSPHSSLGASDAASGVATILEGIRAFLATNKQPKNDIIILITDAEELGLNGADLFVNKHPWVNDVGLVLNFEARGSGGPSHMLVETNRGNANLIREFAKANPEYPVANSLSYSIYKALPNDTDLTVFREDGDIEGFNFAFIDDHYDYHTALDTPERLDRNTLAHQGSYLMALMHHFSEADLNNLKSLSDHVYFNMPFFKTLHYPYEWIWPMFGLAVLAFVVLLIYGFRKKTLSLIGVAKGFVPVLLILVINGVIGYVAWPILKFWYPEFKDILHKFPYEGHTYILALTFLAVAISLFIYSRFKKMATANLLVAPLIIWLVICGLIATSLQGASFFIIPVFGLLAAFLVSLNQKEPNPLLMGFLGLPAVFIFSPFVKMFPVGLGLGLLFAATILVSLLFLMLLPLLHKMRNKEGWVVVFLFAFAVLSIKAHVRSDFSSEKPKPSSLLYLYDTDIDSAYWASYDHDLIAWNSQFVATNEPPSVNANTILSSKYRTKIRHLANAPKKNISELKLSTVLDTIIGDKRHLNLTITHNRPVNRLEIFTNTIELDKVTANGVRLSSYYLENRTNGRLLTHYISDNSSTELELVFTNGQPLELSLFEASNDLLTNRQFTVAKRPDNSIPMPFVLNDAVVLIKKIRFE